MEENINNLNKLLCDLEVMAVKLQNYHWNIQGKEFFVIHEKLEEYYEEIRKQIDEIAEYILTKGNEPLGSMQDFLNKSEIQEAKNEGITSNDIFTNIVADLKILKQDVTEIKQKAEKESDYETSSLMDDYLSSYAKKMWMLNASMKE